MRNMTLLIILLAATFSHLAFSQNGADETAIRELIAQYLDIRAQNDEQALLAILTADADQLTTSGTLRTGRNGVSRGSLASSRNNSGNRSISVDSIRFIKPDVAIVNGAITSLKEITRRIAITSLPLSCLSKMVVGKYLPSEICSRPNNE